MTSARQWLFGLLLCVACDERSSDYTAPVDLFEPATVGSSVVFIERNRHAAYAFEMPSFALATAPLPTGIVQVVPRRGRRLGDEQLLVLANPEPGPQSAATVAAQLVMVEGSAQTHGADLPAAPDLDQADAPRSLERTTYDLPHAWDALFQSDDGQLVLLSSSHADHETLLGASDVGVVALGQDGAAHDRKRDNWQVAVHSLGQALREVTFSSSSSPWQPRVAALRFDTHVSLLQLDPQVQRPEFTVQRQQSAESRAAFSPAQVMFVGRFIVIRDSASSELLVLEYRAEPSTPSSVQSEVPFVVQSHVLPGQLRALLGYKSNANPSSAHLLAASSDPMQPGSRVIDLDLETGHSDQWSLDFSVSRLQCLTASDVCSDQDRVLLFDLTQADAALGVLQLGANAGLVRTEAVRLPRGLHAVWPVQQPSAAAFQNSCRSAASGVQHAPISYQPGRDLLLSYAQTGGASLDIQTLEVRSFGAGIELEQALLDGCSKLWVGVPARALLRYVDLADDAAQGSVALAQIADRVLPMLGSDGTPYVIALHASTFGDATVITTRAPFPSRRHRLFLAQAFVENTP
jgi:hypothetical protein